MLWLNYKTYEKGIGDRGLRLARICEEVSQEFGVRMVVCPQIADIYRLGQQANVEIWAQHVDAILPGKNTGWQLPQAIFHAGASGVLLNHSEHPLSLADLTKTINICKDIGLQTMVFASSVEQVMEFDGLGADYLAFEPPTLVGGTVSVSVAQPNEIKVALAAAVKTNLVVGAGINSVADIQTCLDLGVLGALVASAVMEKTDDPETLLRELIAPFASV